MNHRVLTDEQVQEAKNLREKLGYTKRELAKQYDVSSTTIWYNIYGRKRKTKNLLIYKRQQRDFSISDIPSFVSIVENMKSDGLTSVDVSTILNIPLLDINKIWSKHI